MKRTFYLTLISTIVLCFCQFLVSAQQRQITSKASDESGQPLLGATIPLKGTKTSISTDVNGNFSIQIPADATALEINFTGMKTSEVNISNQSTINIVI